MVQRYAHLSPDHIRAAVEKLGQGESEAGTCTKTGTDDAEAQPGPPLKARKEVVRLAGVEPATLGLEVLRRNRPIDSRLQDFTAH